MKTPQFSIGQRVQVPYADGVQAMIVGCYGTIDGIHYSLRYVAEGGGIIDRTFTAADVSSSNPPPAKPASPDVDALAQTAAKIFKTRHSWELVAPKRRPARKSKSKRRRK